jgi:sugar/nucleoside kinase (ribokinase family)
VDEACAALAPLVARADVTIAGHAEGRTLTGAASPAGLVSALRGWGAREVVVTRGAAGAYHDRGDDTVERPARPVAVIADEVGAGDAFAAGFIVARLRGLDPGACLEWGAAVAAFSVGAIGDARGLPDASEVERLLAGDDETIR